MTNHYNVLGLNMTANEKDIKIAYQRLSIKFHPDKNPDDTDKFYEERFKSVNTAYEILSNPEKRVKFDKGLKEYHSWIAQKAIQNRNVPNRSVPKPTHAIYLITFASSIMDVINQNVENFHQALRTDKSIVDWLCFLDNSYLILVNRSITSTMVANFVSTYMPNKHHLVIEINMNNRNGWLPQNFWDWMNKYTRQQPTPSKF